MHRKVDLLVPPLFQIVRSRHLPTTLRVSALSLLAQCAETSSTAILPWSSDLSAGLLDIIQLEGVTARPMERRAPKENANDDEEDATPSTEPPQTTKSIVEEMDSNPLSVDPKLAPFRRSALHFLSVLLRVTTQNLQDHQSVPVMSLDRANFRMPASSSTSRASGDEDVFPAELVRRMRLVLGYVRATDADGIVKVMAGEVLQLVGSLEMSRLGM